MKTELYVFSGTGNSFWVAKELERNMEDVKMISIPDRIRHKSYVSHADRIGIVFPFYYGTVPAIVKEFIKKLKIPKTSYVFGIMTSGGGVGTAFHDLDRILQSKESRLSYGRVLGVTGNYIVAWYYKYLIRTDEQLKKIYEKTLKELMGIQKDIKENVENTLPHSPLTSFTSRMLTPKRILRDTRPTDDEFKATDNCTGCGECERICSVDNILIENRKPKYGHNCQRCMACFHICPNQALAVKNKRIVSKQYFNQMIDVNELRVFNK